MNAIILRAGVILCLVAAQLHGGAFADDEATGFGKARWTLNQLTRMELDDGGRLRLKRDHWELAAKKPLKLDAEGKAREERVVAAHHRELAGRGFSFFRREVEVKDPLETLLYRVIQETGGYAGASSFQGNGRKRQSLRSPLIEVTLTTAGAEIGLEVHELTGEQRSLEIVDDSRVTRLLFRSPATGFVRILRRGHAVNVCSSINRATRSLTGHSFAEVVQQDEDYFRFELEPLLSDIFQIPVNEALALRTEAVDGSPQFPATTFGNGPLTEGYTADAVAALMRFQVLDGRLRINRFVGDRNILHEEVANVQKEFQDVIDRAVARLEEQDVPPAFINELRLKFEGHENASPAALRWRSFENDRVIGDAFRPQALSDPLLRAFQFFQSTTYRQGSQAGGSMQGENFSVQFSNERISGSVSRNEVAVTMRTEDSDIRISVRETKEHTELVIESETGMLIVSDCDSHPCSVVLVDGGQCESLRGDSLADVINNHEDAFRNRVLPILKQYRISGLDPLGDDVVAAILRRLQVELPDTLDVDSAEGDTEAYVLPLLNDVEYMEILASRLGGDERAAAKKRVAQLRQ